MKKLIIISGMVFSSIASAQTAQPIALNGSYTVAVGPDNLQSNLPAAVYPFYIAWVSDRAGGAGYMVSNGAMWTSDQGPTGATGSPGATGATGATGANGNDGAPGVNAFGNPTSRSLTLATAYQASTSTKPAIVTVNITSTANLSLSGGTTNSADIVVGSTNTVAGGTGTQICKYSNASTGTLTIGLNTNAIAATTCTFALPAGWYYAIRQTAGTITITSAYDQVVG